MLPPQLTGRTEAFMCSEEHPNLSAECWKPPKEGIEKHLIVHKNRIWKILSKPVANQFTISCILSSCIPEATGKLGHAISWLALKRHPCNQLNVHDLMIHNHSSGKQWPQQINGAFHTESHHSHSITPRYGNLNYTLHKLALPRVKPNGGIQFHNATKRLLSQKHNIVSPILAWHTRTNLIKNAFDSPRLKCRKL